MLISKWYKKIEFGCAIRRHHLHKITWFSVINEKLDCKEDDREKALSYDKHTVGVFKKNETPAGHIPIELSNRISFFLKDAEQKFASAFALVTRKRENGLAVPAKFTATTKKLRVAIVL